MLAVRVPPSASRTSQSIQSVRSPTFARSTTARRLRPISRWISTVRPSTLPPRSRALRVLVLPGNIPYSAVSQPLPLPMRNGGTANSTQQGQSTVVRPMRTRTLPGAWRVYRRRKVRERSSSGARPSWRFAGVTFHFPRGSFVAEQPMQQRLLGVHAVARLLEDDTAVAIEHVAGHFL